MSVDQSRWRSVLPIKALIVVLGAGLAGVLWAGCGGDDGNESVNSVQEGIEKRAEEGKEGVEEDAEELEQGAEGAKEKAEKGLEEGKAEAEKGIEKGKKEAEEGFEEAEEELENYAP